MWKDSYSSIFLSTKCLGLEECIILVDQVLTALESSSSKGFLTGYDLTTFPIVSEILPALLQGVESKVFNGEESMESYK